MSEAGFVKAYRTRFNHELFRNEKWCRGFAWDWMVAEAAWKEHRVSINGKTVTLRRGQFTSSFRYMAERFDWSKSSVERFINRLKTDAMIGTATETGQLVISICNYEKYQSMDSDGGTAFGTASGTGAGHQRDKIEEGKERKEVRQQPREPVRLENVLQPTDRERLLSAMGADPISGMFGPNGRRLGTVADTEEAAKWAVMGLTPDQQCAVIAERCAAMRKNKTGWTPGRFAYFTGAMADLASRKAAPIPAGIVKNGQCERAAQMARYEKIIKRA